MRFSDRSSGYDSANISVQSLGNWFVDPLSHAEAQRVRLQARSVLQGAYASGNDAFPGQVQDLIASFWLDGPNDQSYSVLSRVAEGWQLALLTLVYGQLLATRRLSPAMAYLDAGFAAAVDFMAPRDYFRVMKRHDLLRALSWYAEPRVACSLEDLLREALIIEQLRGRGARSMGKTGNGVDITG